MRNAVDKIRERLERVSQALRAANVPYAVAGGNAVAAWVTRVDEAAVRNTRDVDIVLRRADLPAACGALEHAGFVFRHVTGMDLFLDGPDARVRDAVHIIFAGEKVRPHYVEPAPDVAESEDTANFQLLTLDALVRMKLTSFSDRDRVHVRDLIDVGLVDTSWLERVPTALKTRLQELLDTPEGWRNDDRRRGGVLRCGNRPKLPVKWKRHVLGLHTLPHALRVYFQALAIETGPVSGTRDLRIAVGLPIETNPWSRETGPLATEMRPECLRP